MFCSSVCKCVLKVNANEVFLYQYDIKYRASRIIFIAVVLRTLLRRLLPISVQFLDSHELDASSVNLRRNCNRIQRGGFDTVIKQVATVPAFLSGSGWSYG